MNENIEDNTTKPACVAENSSDINSNTNSDSIVSVTTDTYDRIITKNLRINSKNYENSEKILTKDDIKNTKEKSIEPETTSVGSTTNPPTNETITTKNLNLDAELYPISTPTFKPIKVKNINKRTPIVIPSATQVTPMTSNITATTLDNLDNCFKIQNDTNSMDIDGFSTEKTHNIFENIDEKMDKNIIFKYDTDIKTVSNDNNTDTTPTPTVIPT
ncbi:hypothetical protein AX774_g7057, partial [Zancudomyces culisetae]